MNTSSATWDCDYPRPQLRRSSFLSLNGSWLLNGHPITVPFPPQAALSGYRGSIGDTLHYEKAFTLPAGFLPSGHSLRLHFGAVDQLARVFLNGIEIGSHTGGYLPFWFDITAALRPGENTLTLEATDTLSHLYPYGKQRKKRGGMWYTPVSGIWQSVWLEAVPPNPIEQLTILPDLCGVTLSVETRAPSFTVTLPLASGAYQHTCRCGETLRINLTELGETPHLWTPEDPFLYPFTIEAGQDRVKSYFALRTVEIRPFNGQKRLCLNGQPRFLNGVLDQGYFADGLYLPATPDGYTDDILRMKALGFNLLRKHIKIEPEAFYAACDRCGMLVMQDMVNNGPYCWLLDTALPNLGLQRRIDRSPGGKKRKQIFEQHARQTQLHLYNHPCVIGYTIFNEGWGQFDADRLYRLCQARDPSRFYDATSGWFTRRESDVDSRHVYFRNQLLRARRQRPLLLSECGGYARAIPGHLFHENAHYGYGTAANEDALTARIATLFSDMVLPSIPHGLCGCIYTQLSDVEDEINGLYTYDRAVCKVNAQALRDIASQADAALQACCQV